jgi:probable F420-dependent oxidoreductase
MASPGTIGISSAAPDAAAAVADAREAEALGYASIWLPGGQGNNLPIIEAVVRGSDRIEVAAGIIPVDIVPARDVAATYAALQREAPDRFTVGLGGAHGPRPLATLGAYLDVLDREDPGVPPSARVLAALGPRMLELARDRCSGAYPYLITPEYTAEARATLGDSRRLAVQLNVVPEADPAAARAIAAEPLKFLGTVPGYVKSFLRMGFSREDVAEVSDRLIDGVVAWGGVAAIVRRVEAHLDAGADQVVLRLNFGDDESASDWRKRLAEALLD